MSDKELLEAAARAICKTNWQCSNCHGAYRFDSEGVPYWNPLTDDGEALRLAVKTGRTDLSLLVAKLALADECKGLTGVAVVRRAIVWDVAAAEIGSPHNAEVSGASTRPPGYRVGTNTGEKT